MNHLVILNARAGELEKILSGLKTMIVREFTPADTNAHQLVNPGDSLYFLRDKDDCTVRVRATAVRVMHISNRLENDLPQNLKELQPRLQLTEDQYNYWSTREGVLLVEFESAHKIDVIHTSAHKVSDRTDWIAFEAFSQISD